MEPHKIKQGKLYSGPVLGTERWKFWKQALSIAVGKTDISEDSRRLASKAADLMDVMEKTIHI
jgi:hypothetical protein